VHELILYVDSRESTPDSGRGLEKDLICRLSLLDVVLMGLGLGPD
jgi:hypothetical protein